MQCSNGILDCFCHCIHFALLGKAFTTDNSIDSGFYTREILVIILVQRIYLCNGFINLSVVCIFVNKSINRILDCFCHCIYLCLLGFTFRSVNSVNGIFYRRIIFIKAAIKSLCTCDGCIDSCVISGNVIVIPHKSWMADSSNPFNTRTGIGLKTIKYICGGKVRNGSPLFFVALSSYIRKRRRVICFRVIRPTAIFYCAVEGISHPTSISIFIYAHVGRRNYTVLYSCNVCTSNDSANSGLKGVDNNLTIKPTIRNR